MPLVPASHWNQTICSAFHLRINSDEGDAAIVGLHRAPRPSPMLTEIRLMMMSKYLRDLASSAECAALTPNYLPEQYFVILTG
jgi:hypothetical protein